MYNELFESIFDFLKENISGKVMLALILIVVACCFTKCDYYREHFQVPICSLVHAEEKDIVQSDIKLAVMSIIATPMIVIKRENEVVYAVKVKNYSVINYASSDDNNESISYCSVDVADEQQIKIVGKLKF